jgi:hypothetical protein
MYAHVATYGFVRRFLYLGNEIRIAVVSPWVPPRGHSEFC